LKGLLIVSIIAAVLWLIGMISANIIIGYRDEFFLTVRVLFIKIRIVPKKKKKPRISAFTAKGYRKKLEKLEKKRLKKEQKKAEKQAKKEQKKQNKGTKEEKPKEKRDIAETVGLITDVVSGLLGSFGKHLRIKSERLHITLASNDAAKTALLYGSTAQALSWLLEILNRVTDFTYDPGEFSLDVDFLSDRIKADILIVFRIRVWHVFAMLGRTLVSYLRSDHRGKNKDRKHKTEKTDNADKTENNRKEADQDGR